MKLEYAQISELLLYFYSCLSDYSSKRRKDELVQENIAVIQEKLSEKLQALMHKKKSLQVDPNSLHTGSFCAYIAVSIAVRLSFLTADSLALCTVLYNRENAAKLFPLHKRNIGFDI